MSREIALVIMGLIVNCGGFTTRSTAQRWKPNTSRRAIANNSNSSNGKRHSRHWCGRGGRSRQRSLSLGVVQMSIREMIGADVESGGLFDPLGERQGECTQESTQERPWYLVQRGYTPVQQQYIVCCAAMLCVYAWVWVLPSNLF